MNDGSEDQEAPWGSWPLQNIQLADSLKLKGYDFHFSFGGGTYHAALAASGVAGVSYLAVARLPSQEDGADLRTKRGGEGETGVPGSHLQSVGEWLRRRLCLKSRAAPVGIGEEDEGPDCRQAPAVPLPRPAGFAAVR